MNIFYLEKIAFKKFRASSNHKIFKLYYKGMTFSELRHQFPRFYYKSFAYTVTSEGLELEFEYELSPTYRFHPQLLIYGVVAADLAKLTPAVVDAYVFNLGLVEMLSYWKTTCSPQIIVEAGPLDPAQKIWWREVLINGLGEFFFVNQIDFTATEFVTITSSVTPPDSTTLEKLPPPPTPPEITNQDSILIPVGGGKDSVVTLELLKAWQPLTSQLAAFHLNPAPANQDTAQASGLTKQLFVHRQIDPLLAEMNADGFLNGHTPFSALVAFLSTFVAHLNDYHFVALSNEQSSNEGNLVFHGFEINHQYSKSFAFEQAFQTYAAQYLPGSPWYFSLLRPWSELQIAQYFAQFPVYHRLFRSCNRGKKTNTWCGECSKCLFAYLILQPFINPTKLETLFGKNLLADLDLLPIAQELAGYGQKKPLECVGTREESLIAFYLSCQMYQEAGVILPPLLQAIQTEILSQETTLDHRATTLLASWSSHHALPPALATFMERK